MAGFRGRPLALPSFGFERNKRYQPSRLSTSTVAPFTGKVGQALWCDRHSAGVSLQSRNPPQSGTAFSDQLGFRVEFGLLAWVCAGASLRSTFESHPYSLNLAVDCLGSTAQNHRFTSINIENDSALRFRVKPFAFAFD